MNVVDFYRAFEDRYRGSRELIRSRLEVYLPFVQPLQEIYRPAFAIDLGCGRGEWLELLQNTGFVARGVDLDGGMLAGCADRGLTVLQGDALAHLRSLDDASQCIVSGFHIAEHLAFGDLEVLVEQALRVLRPGGLLILETPNPENIVVGTNTFYLDPTHSRPIPPLLLSFLVEYYGFARVCTVRLQESPELRDRGGVTLLDVLGGVSLDYAVVAQKAAPQSILVHFDAPFAATYGLTVNELASRYDHHWQQQAGAPFRASTMTEALDRITTLQDRLIDTHTQLVRTQAACEKLQTDAHWATERLHATLHQVQALELRAHHLDTECNALRHSASWRVTAPLRWLVDLCVKPLAVLHSLLVGRWRVKAPLLAVAARGHADPDAGTSVSCRQLEIFRDLKQAAEQSKEN